MQKNYKMGGAKTGKEDQKTYERGKTDARMNEPEYMIKYTITHQYTNIYITSSLGKGPCLSIILFAKICLGLALNDSRG